MSRKTIALELDIEFEGSYYSIKELPRVVQGWIDAALEDRDNLTDWSVHVTSMTEDGEDVPVP